MLIPHPPPSADSPLLSIDDRLLSIGYVQGREATLDLPPGEVHVWRLSLDLPPAPARRCEAYLSADERQRADRFYAEGHRAAFVAARGSLRALLAAYVGGAPEAIR